MAKEVKEQNWFQMNWKKILAGAGLVAVGVVIGVLATNSRKETDDTIDMICDALHATSNKENGSYKDSIKRLITTPHTSSYIASGDNNCPYTLSDLGKPGEGLIKDGRNPDDMVTGLLINSFDSTKIKKGGGNDAL
mgnify:CR=1 FL=1